MAIKHQQVKALKNSKAAKRRSAVVNRKRTAAKINVDRVKQKLAKLKGELKTFLSLSFAWKANRSKRGKDWMCSRIERRGTTFGASCTQKGASGLTMCKAVLRVKGQERLAQYLKQVECGNTARNNQRILGERKLTAKHCTAKSTSRQEANAKCEP